MIAILGAMFEEVRYLLGTVEILTTVEGLSRTFCIASYNEEQLVIGVTGVGQVAAGITTQYVIDHFSPKNIVLLGTAGGLGSAGRGTLCLINEVCSTSEDSEPIVLKPATIGQRLISTNQAVTDTATKDSLTRLKFDCVDMEGYGVASAAHLNARQCHIVKVISDLADENFQKDFGSTMDELVDLPARWLLTNLSRLGSEE